MYVVQHSYMPSQASREPLLLVVGLLAFLPEYFAIIKPAQVFVPCVCALTRYWPVEMMPLINAPITHTHTHRKARRFRLLRRLCAGIYMILSRRNDDLFIKSCRDKFTPSLILISSISTLSLYWIGSKLVAYWRGHVAVSKYVWWLACSLLYNEHHHLDRWFCQPAT